MFAAWQRVVFGWRAARNPEMRDQRTITAPSWGNINVVQILLK